MLNCAHCQPILLDYVYGLLEADELQEVRTHLDACPVCQAVLETVRAQQNLLARAARAINEVPEFALPSLDVTTDTRTTEIPLVPAASAPLAPKRALWRRPWVAWATAAMVFLTISAGISLYRSTLHGYQEELALKRQEYKKIEQQVVQLPDKYKTLQAAAVQKLRAEAKPYLRVVGPAQVQANATATLHVTTRQAEGELTASTVLIRCEETATKKIVKQVLVANAKGEARVELASADFPPGSSLNLIVEAQTANGQARLQEEIRVAPPALTARIDTNKNVYQVNDVLFFRVLVLDRSSLKPPSQPIWLRAKLLNPKGESVAQLQLPTGDGGMLAAEIPIEQHFPAGNYVLEVAPANAQSVLPLAGSSAAGLNGLPSSYPSSLAAADLFARKSMPPILPVTRLPLEIVRDLRTPYILFDKDLYTPGELVTGKMPSGPANHERATASFGGQTVPATIQAEGNQGGGSFSAGRGSNQGGAGVGGFAPKQESLYKEMTKNSANALSTRRFAARMPSNVPAGAKNLPFTLKVLDGKRQEEYKAVVPLQPSDYAIDFFPEGGDLIAGVSNRVFYRVYAKNGEPVSGEGWVILLSRKHEPIDSRYQLGLGYFDFTPDTKETYTVRITSPRKTTEIAQPFARLGIRPTGIVLHVPAAVGKQGEPIALTLRNQGPPRKLMLVAQCRGQIVDQRWIDVKTGAQDFTLQTPAAVRGMVRITAYEVRNSTLDPLAERLIYRSATERLDLGITLNTQQREAGRKMTGKISARTEKGAPAASWVLASVVDERFQAKPRSLSAYFFLLNETPGSTNLDNAQIVLHDSAASVPLLERFLGTHGWRRFVSKKESILPAAAPENPTPLVFTRENMPLPTLQKQYAEKLAQALTPLHQQASLEQLDLEDQQKGLSDAVNLARLNLWSFEGQIQVWLRLALGMVVALLLAVSLLLLLIGVYRVVRRHKVATSAFGSAFACLAVCLVIVFAGTSLAPLDVAAPLAEKQRGPLAWDLRELEWLPFPSLPKLDAAPPAGEFALNTSQQRDKARQAGFLAAGVGLKADQRETRQAPFAILAQSFADRGRDQVRALDEAKSHDANAMRLRYESAKKAMASPAGLAQLNIKPAATTNVPAKAPQPNTPAAKKSERAGEHQKDAQAKLSDSLREREYAYEYVPNLSTDTLLWSPTLWLQQGTAEVHFDIASGQTTYRVLLLGHSPSGRFGFYETHLDVP